MQYKILKDFGNFKADDVVDVSAFDESVLLEELVADGTVAVVQVGVDPAIPGGDTSVPPANTTTPPADPAAGASDVPPATDPGADTTPPADTVPPVDTTTPPADATGEQVEKTLIFNNKTVISKTVRIVEDKEVHHVRLEDGTEMDLTDEEHDAMITASQAQ